MLFAIAPLAFQNGIDLKLADRYFHEAKWIADDDAGELWGKSLAGPILFVDGDTREAVASEAPAEPSFKLRDGVYVGKLPASIGIANTAFDWSGKRWSMVMWPLPTNRAQRANLMMHELFHRLQPELGVPLASPQNAQLETLDGRLWLQLELKALSQALAATENKTRVERAQDALSFRWVRQQKDPNAKAEENALELNEGLAEYTGSMLRGGWESETRLWLADQVSQGVGLPAYARRFAYLTGPAYGYLLNVIEAEKSGKSTWRTRVNSWFNLAEELGKLVAFQPGSTDTAIQRAAPYGYAELLPIEQARQKAHDVKVAEIRKRLVDAPVLRLDLRQMNVSFDPRNVLPLGAEGNYYESVTLIDDWGTLTVTGGAIIANDFSHAVVAAPSNRESMGAGWTLTLAKGWSLAKGKDGNWTLKT